MTAPPEATCPLCNSVYRGKALGGLAGDGWERVGEVLHARRWCLCQRDRPRGGPREDAARGAITTAHPGLAANVVIVSPAHDVEDRLCTVVRVTATAWVDEHGTKYRRDTGHRIGGGFALTNIVANELPRLEAWAASLEKR